MAAICVYCSSSERIADRYLTLATAVGATLAERGHTLVSGGGRVSMMGAVAVAARAGGAHTLGVIPVALVDDEVADVDADELVVTRNMRERKAIMDERCDAFLALPGGLGTLEELLEVWTSRSLGLHAKPVVVLDPDGEFDPFFDWIERLKAGGFVREDACRAVTRTRSLSAAFAELERVPRQG
ncbi:MAG: TIGR00730 family Rossman fold protein [Mycobacteriales bacterium]